MIRRPPRSTLLTHSFPTRRSSDLFNITRAALGKRYTPELNIELPVRRGLLAIARDPIFIDSMCELANNVDEARHHAASRSEEHTSELQSLMRISYAVFCLKKKK